MFLNFKMRRAWNEYFWTKTLKKPQTPLNQKQTNPHKPNKLTNKTKKQKKPQKTKKQKVPNETKQQQQQQKSPKNHKAPSIIYLQ